MSDSDDFEDEVIDAKTTATTKFSSNDLLSNTAVNSRASAPVPVRRESAPQAAQSRHVSPEITKNLKAVEKNENDKEAWSNLASSLFTANVDEARSVFQVIMKSFPTSSRFLRMFCDMESRARNYNALEHLLEVYMPKCASVDIYVYYCQFYDNKLSYHKTGAELLQAREEIEALFNSAVEKVGLFYDADVLWRAYKSFLDKQPRNDSDESYRAKCIQKWRSFFQRVVVLPIRNVDSFWSDYSQFEASLVVTSSLSTEEKKETIKSILSQVSEAYKAASEESKKRGELWKDIKQDDLAMRTIGDDDKKQIALWKKLLAYETTNPMKLPEETHRHHMDQLYRRCVACCRYCPDLWILYISFVASFDWSNATRLMADAKEAMPACALLRLAICDLLESRGLVQEAKEEYEKMIGSCETSTGWIVYQQFTRRNFGVAEARHLFQRARLSMLAPEVFLAAAHLEYEVNEEAESALSVLRCGLTHFAKDQGYILSFAEFLLGLNDFENARILLENGIQMIGEDDCPALWEKLLLIESQYSMSPSSLGDIVKSQKRYSNANPKKRSLQGLISSLYRYNVYNFTPTSKEDRALLKRMNPSNLERDRGTKKLIVRNKQVIVVTAVDTLATSETPLWMREIIRKLPVTDRGKARSSIVDSLIDVLATVKLPRMSA
ncbi:hypothetical protein WA556_004798, partial [Blastocystis sp. ATCC 50177/Nand II]